MFVIFLKEVNIFLSSLIAYLVIGCFLGMSGLVLWVFPDTNVLEYGFAEMDVFFKYAPYLFLLLVPSITMRSFSEEKKKWNFRYIAHKPGLRRSHYRCKISFGCFFNTFGISAEYYFLCFSLFSCVSYGKY